MTGQNITYFSGALEHLDDVKDLWERLNKHHESISSHFKDDFRSFRFLHRRAKLLKKHQDGKTRIEIAIDQDQPVGYIISSITEDRVGEIESIFVRDEYRGQAIGTQLMERALAWLESQNGEILKVKVAVGNEASYDFYAKFGFYPWVTTLKRKTQVDT